MHNFNCLFQNPGHQSAGFHGLSFILKADNIFLVLCMSNNRELYSKYCKYSDIKTLDSVLFPQEDKLFLFVLGGN